MANSTRISIEKDISKKIESGLLELLEDGSLNEDEFLTHVKKSPWSKEFSTLLNLDISKDSVKRRLSIFLASYPYISEFKNTLNIKSSLIFETFELYIPIAIYIANRSNNLKTAKNRAAVFGINGGQGSGKTTINAFLQIILKNGLGLRTAGFSIDDVYKTYTERQTMASKVHPLFAIRSVAGTHDTALAIETISSLSRSKNNQTVSIPKFNKMAKGGEGDRLPRNAWDTIEGPLDVVIFEGWFVGARPQPAEMLLNPINQREENEDPDAIWRKKVNSLLADEYQELFNMLDDLLVIQGRSMEDVYKNRELQEQHNRKKIAEAEQRGDEIGEQGAMSPDEVIDFISLYERTTRYMLETLPNESRITLYLGDNHQITELSINPVSKKLRGYL